MKPQNNSGLYNRSLSNHTLIHAEDNNSTESYSFFTDVRCALSSFVRANVTVY